jgi:hypothetical protein
MNFEELYRYGKDADTVMRMFADRAYFEKKYAETTLAYEVLEHELSDERFRIKCKLTMPSSAPVPGFAKKILGETMNLVQEDIWDLKSRTGQLNIEMPGVPVKISAAMRLGQGAAGGENQVSWSINCKIPLIGGKLEKFIASDIKAKSPADLKISEAILADY